MDIALVHGSYHGAWCWDLLRPELEKLGHSVITMDLPISEPGLGAADYARVVEEALPAGSEPVLVGHSTAGLIIPLVAANRPIHRMIFLAAMMPVPGKSANAQREEEPIDGLLEITDPEWTDLGNEVWMVGANTARQMFFSDVLADLARWAIARLRPQCYRMMIEVTPLTAWPAAPSTSIVCADDRTTNPDWIRAAARKRLGVEAVGIPGGHSPFLSRPVELARLIDSLA
jgi:pimeloyl-ACP methyl ester carboxylesterase